jgi:membrane-bound lytic murein transglycosylase B
VTARSTLPSQSLLCALLLLPVVAQATDVSSVAPAAAAAAEPPAVTDTAPGKVLPGHTRFDLNRADIVAFVDRVAGKGLARNAVFAVLAKAEPQPKIIEAMNRPAEKTLAWWEYRAHFLSSERIDAGARLWREHRELFDAIAMERHVQPEYVLGIIGVETYFGRIMGRYRVLDALTTLAFDYPARGEYFQRELEQFLLLTRSGELDPQSVLGSYAGAMGAGQFMPSSFQSYAVDESGTGHRDLWTDWADIFGSVANYLAQHGWEYGQPALAEASLGSAPEPVAPASSSLNETLGALRARGMQVASLQGDATPCMTIAAPLSDGMSYRVGFRNFYVITRYNRSPLYAMAVHDLAQAISARVLAPDAP